MATETDKIVVDYEANVKGLTAQLKTVQTEMAKTEKAGVDAAKGTEDAFKGTEKAAQSLKSQLKDLKAQLAIATDPKDVERLAKAAGEIKNKLDDATKAAQIFASDSKFEQVGTALRGIAGNLLSLNFKQAADQSKLLVAASKQITFKEALGGIKDLGVTLGNIGKSLLSNPLFLLGSAITLIISNFDKLTKAGGAIGAFFSGISNIISTITGGISDLADAIGLTDSKSQALAASQKKLSEETIKYLNDVALAIEKNNLLIKQNLGILTGEEAKRLSLSKSFLAEYTAEVKKQNDEIAKARKEANLNRITESFDEKIQLLADEKRFQAVEANIKAQHVEVLKAIQAKYQSDVEVVNSEAVKAQRDIDIKAAKEREDRLRAELEKLKAINKKFAEDNTITPIPLKGTSEADKQKKTEKDLKKSQKAITDNFAASQQAQVDAAKAASEELAKIEKAKQDIQQETIDLVFQSLDILKELNNRRLNETLDKEKAVSEETISIYDEELRTRQISKEQYDRKVAQENKRLAEAEKKAKKDAFESDKSIAIVQAAINTALAVTKALSSTPYPYNLILAALVAASGAAEIAVINSQPTPKFEKGGKVKGARHSEGGALIEAEKDEWIINRTQSIKHDKLLESINKGKVESFINEVYLAPVLRKQMQKHEESKNKSFANNIANSILLKQSLNDGNILESLKKSRKNDQEIAMFLVKNLNPKVNKYNW